MRLERESGIKRRVRALRAFWRRMPAVCLCGRTPGMLDRHRNVKTACFGRRFHQKVNGTSGWCRFLQIGRALSVVLRPPSELCCLFGDNSPGRQSSGLAQSMPSHPLGYRAQCRARDRERMHEARWPIPTPAPPGRAERPGPLPGAHDVWKRVRSPAVSSARRDARPRRSMRRRRRRSVGPSMAGGTTNDPSPVNLPGADRTTEHATRDSRFGLPLV